MKREFNKMPLIISGVGIGGIYGKSSKDRI